MIRDSRNVRIGSVDVKLMAPRGQTPGLNRPLPRVLPERSAPNEPLQDWIPVGEVLARAELDFYVRLDPLALVAGNVLVVTVGDAHHRAAPRQHKIVFFT